MVVLKQLAVGLAAAALLVGLGACGGDDGGDGDGDAETVLDQTAVTSNLEEAGYTVADAPADAASLPSLVDADFATGADSGFEGAIQVSGNGLEPFNPTDVSKTGFVLFYDGADAAAAADDSIGSGEGQRLEGNALFVYGTGLEAPPAAFDKMVSAAVGE